MGKPCLFCPFEPCRAREEEARPRALVSPSIEPRAPSPKRMAGRKRTSDSCSGRRGSRVGVRADPAGKDFSPEPEGHQSALAPRRGARGNDRTRGAGPLSRTSGLVPSSTRAISDERVLEVLRSGNADAQPAVADTWSWAAIA